MLGIMLGQAKNIIVSGYNLVMALRRVEKGTSDEIGYNQQKPRMRI